MEQGAEGESRWLRSVQAVFPPKLAKQITSINRGQISTVSNPKSSSRPYAAYVHAGCLGSIYKGPQPGPKNDAMTAWLKAGCAGNAEGQYALINAAYTKEASCSCAAKQVQSLKVHRCRVCSYTGTESTGTRVQRLQVYRHRVYMCTGAGSTGAPVQRLQLHRCRVHLLPWMMKALSKIMVSSRLVNPVKACAAAPPPHPLEQGTHTFTRETVGRSHCHTADHGF